MYYKTIFNATEKVWFGPDIVPLYHPGISIGQAVLDILEQNPQKICQISADTGEHMTSQEMHNHIIRIAVNLLDTGLHKGDVICIAAKNSKHVAPVVFAALLLGLTVNTMDPDFDVSEMAHSLNLAKPIVIFCDDENTETVTRTLTAIDLKAEMFVFTDKTLSVFTVKSVNELLKPNADEQTFLPPNLGDISNLPAVILCSSGTTGLPKGVCLSHQSMLTQLRRQWNVTTDDVLFSFSSLYWLSGWIVLLNGMLNGAARIITKESYSPDLFLSLIETHQITATISAPHQMLLMLQSDKMRTTNLDSLKNVLVGGSYVSDTLKESLQTCVKNGKVLVAYGATETAGFMSMTYCHDRNGSVGQLSAGTRVKIIDETDNALGPKKIGEICAKQYYPFLGYINNKKATDETIDTAGWIRTGDMGYFDDDGFLYCVDRKKEILKYCNHQISPSEIEVIIEKIPGVLAVTVIGVPDLITTDLPAALVVRKSEDLTAEFIYYYVAQNVSDHKLLRGGIYFVDKLPLTHSGKIMRREAKQIATKRYIQKLKAELNK